MKLTVIFATVLSLAVVNQAIPLDKRRFGQEHTPEADATFQEVKDLAQGSDKEAEAGNLSGAMVRALLAKAPACDQQDRADEVIDLGQKFGDDDKLQSYIKVAQTYRQLERNTPNAGQPSELCDKAPRHKELDGLVQAQDPTGNPDNGDNPDNGEKPKDGDKPKKPKEKKPKDGDKPKDDDKPKDGDKPKKPKEKKPKDGDKPKDGGNPADGDNGTNIAETNPVGGVEMPKIQQVGGDRPFVVNGDSFVGVDAAHGRQCDVQHNACFNKFNGGDKSFSGADCDNQNNDCRAGPPVFE